MRRTRISAGLLLFLLLHPVFESEAIEVAGVAVPNQVEDEGTVLRLNGAGLREAKFFKFDVYVASLYADRPSSEPQELLAADRDKLLVLRFVRSVDVGEIREDLDEGFEGQDQKFNATLEALKAFMTDVESGEQIAFRFHPQLLEVTRPDGEIARFEGAEFSRAVLEIWLGGNAAHPELRTQLLGHR